MPANTDPIYSKAPDVQAATFLGTAANADSTGGGTLNPVFQADATNGGFVQSIQFQPVATTAAAGTTTSARVFLSNITGSWTGNSSSNTWLIGELTLTGVTMSATAGLQHYVLTINKPIPAGWRIVVSFGTSLAANTGYAVTVFGGKY